MHTYEIRLSPKPGTGGGNLTTQVTAVSDMQARQIAQAQYPGHRVEAIRRVA